MLRLCLCFFFFKQKTAYEMRISDWSSDVCSSDLEFAEQEERKGKRVIEAAVEAARIRLRPILMTSFAFIFGVLPLAIATGAGANSRVAIGTSVIGDRKSTRLNSSH